jgi:aminopeptidase-like protein
MQNNNSQAMHQWAKDLFPICRSLTGEGTRETLRYFQKLLPDLKIKDIPSGTEVFDWTVPDEWNIKDAYVLDGTGNRVIDFKKHNLHVVGYSEPVDKEMTFEELDKHLYSLPEQPDAIPYITSYYERRWGFCLPENQRQQLRKNPEARYKVKIDSTLAAGVLNYGELIIPGKTDKEILLSTYVCHPSMANNELSGPVVTAALALWIQNTLQDREYSYRIVFIPETIGSIAYLSRNLEAMKKNTVAGFVLTCVGDERTYSYLASRMGDTLADAAARHVLSHHYPDYKSYTYLDRGSDERQYCSPGVDLPVCLICRSKFLEYPEYHTSLDDLTFVTPEGLNGSLEVYQKVITLLENNKTYRCKVKCEPQLGKRGLYPTLLTRESNALVRDMMNCISYADGKHTLIEIAEKINVYAGDLIPIVKKMLAADLFEEV